MSPSTVRRAEPTPLTLTDYAALDEPEHEWVTELVRGVVVREPRPRSVHGEIQVELAFHLKAWARSRGAVVTVESGYILANEPPTVRGPDVAVTLERRVAESTPGGWIRGAPDLAVEVLSPSDSASSIQQKVLEYFDAGARMVWVVDPEVRAVIVHRPDGSASMIRDGETLKGEGVLEGFAVPVRELLGPS